MEKDDNQKETSEIIIKIGRYFLVQLGRLPKGRLVKLFYLLDWRAALVSDTTITKLKWYYNYFGPYLPEVVDMLIDSGDVILRREDNAMGSEAEYLKLKSTETSEESINNSLNETEKKMVDEVIAATEELSFADFIKLVYSTFPIRVSQKYTELDLPNLAKTYKQGTSDLQN